MMKPKKQRRRTKRNAANSVPQDQHAIPTDSKREAVVPFSSFTTPVGLRDYSGLHLWVMIAIPIAVFICYFPALTGEFVWDDAIFADEVTVHRASGIWDIWFDPVSISKEGHYWPIVYTSFWLEHKLWGLNPTGYHIVNVFLHALNSLLLVHLLRRLSVSGAWMAAAIFAVHPVNVESVAWIIERKDLLSALFSLLTVLFWVRFTESSRWQAYALALAFLVAGMLSKSIVVTLPAALLVLHWWKQGRITVDVVLRLLPLLAVALCIALADYSYYKGRENISLDLSFFERMLLAAHALWFYLGKIVWPVDQVAVYPHWPVESRDLSAWAYFVFGIAGVLTLWFARHRIGRGALAGVLIFAVTLSPLLGFIDYGYMQFSYVADRFQYIAKVGILALLATGYVLSVSRLSRPFQLGSHVVALLAGVLLGVATWQHSANYKDEIALFSHIASINPQARDVHNNLATAYRLKGEYEKALETSLKAVKQNPDSSKAQHNLGLVYLKLGMGNEGKNHLDKAVSLNPKDKAAHLNLGEWYRNQKQYDDALNSLTKAIELDSKYVLAYGKLAAVLLAMNRHEEALAQAENALKHNLSNEKLSTYLATKAQALRGLQRYDEAIRVYKRAIELDPNNAQPRLEAAELMVQQNRVVEADALFAETKQLFPDSNLVDLVISVSYRLRGDYNAAVDLFLDLVSKNPNMAQAHGGLGHTYFDLEQYDNAAAALSRALSLQSDSSSAASQRALLGKAYVNLKQMEKAASQFEKVLQTGEHRETALEYLAYIRFSQERFDDALELYERWSEISPNNSHIYSSKGTTLYRLNRFEDAARMYEKALSLSEDPNFTDTVEKRLNSTLDRIGRREKQ